MLSICFRTLKIALTLTALLTAQLSQATIPEIAPGTAFKPLEPTRDHAMITQQIMNNLLRGHYEHQRLDDKLSSRVLDILLDDIDSTRSYLLAADVKEFEQYRYSLDEALNRGDMRPAFIIFNRFQQRVSERLSFLLNELHSKAADYHFDTDERLDLDREKAPWATTSAELDDLWRKRLKNSILNLKMAGKEKDAIIELLSKRYQNQLNRVHQSQSEDAYQTFMNAVTRAFDPHTQYFSPRNTENFNINMSLSLQGIGAVLQTEDEHTKVVRLVPAGPAAKAGNLQPADKIIGVGQAEGDIVDVIGWRLDEVVELIRGPKSTTVRLEILPANSSGTDSKIISIVRDEVKLEEQSAQKDVIEVKDGDVTHKIGVIDIPTFYIDFQGRMENKPDYKSTTRDVTVLINELKEEGIDGLIIDLRNNGGGSLEEAITLTGLFIPQGPVVQVRSTHGRVEVLPDQDPSVLYDGPITVLVNRLSASASEIFAGAIQDYGRGLIVGGQTFGKGTVQSLRPLRSGQLKITQAKFYRVSGDSTQHQGVIPDILFPSLFDKEKIGESALEEALPWDTIRPAEYNSNKGIAATLPALRQLHQTRIEHNPDFRFLREQKALITELRQQTQVSLNEKVREQERKANDDKRLKLENERRKAKGMPQLTSIDDEESDNAADAEKKDDKKPEEDDALLIEAGHILVDYMNIQTASLTAQREAK
ncbi:carboxy terminal-processing peptidase [Thalassolituus alkanivorans]|uniref:carboxy terminal-processing peptidase n=1 Tax=Thalassolituus alkanivorans TaxID=2881055 RepID=UPI001E4EA4FE|nr:carboxy terminal-processing peptidase [Thalassolituus alkanivorans]MCB2386666.1 carboxy terminal-processing peptidase [Thalassolituus alkanivorans]MCB2424156.1 carboxy terminal-processing peptidase [Thalassolituus alkanivorans]